jgi:hypothetical protein
MKRYLPVILVVGGVHLALLLILTVSSNLSARTGSPTPVVQGPAEALRESCSVHRVAHVPGIAQVNHGKAATAATYLNARTRLFPNSWYFVESGAVTDAESPQQASVRYCPSCRIAEQRWREQYARRSTP